VNDRPVQGRLQHVITGAAVLRTAQSVMYRATGSGVKNAPRALRSSPVSSAADGVGTTASIVPHPALPAWEVGGRRAALTSLTPA